MTAQTNHSSISGELSIPEKSYEQIQQNIISLAEFQAFVEKPSFASRPVTELINFFLVAAVQLRASDIHMEPSRETVGIRLRIDGVLHDAATISPALYKKIISRFKLLSKGIKFNVSERPQDGRFSFSLPSQGAIEVRTSTLPAEYGEALVMRVLNPQSLLALEESGLRPDLVEMFRKEIKKPNGMIIVTGPTGSGKTTTLYAFLQEIQSPEIKIITIEDPIEYHLKNISQTQVNPAKGYTFAIGLQAIMRQDPDIILVGEIRDEKTAEIALQAALTGHFVFATLHTNNAATTFSRLLSMKAKPSIVAAAMNLSIAQRLIRRACASCSQLKEATPAQRKTIEKAIQALPTNIKPSLPAKLELPAPKGCKECNMTGYQGRIGLFEALLVDQETETFLLKQPSISALEAFAEKRGMITMYQDGILKVLQHLTTIEEVERETSSQ